MKKVLCAIAVATALLPATSMANELVFGVKGGIYAPSDSALDPTAMLSAQIGYEFLDLAAVDIAAEFEVGTTIADGDVDAAKLDLGAPPGVKAEYGIRTIGAYLSARTAGPIYAIGRIGVVKTDVEVTASLAGISESEKFDETGVAVGAGVGFSLGVRTEVELTRHSIDDEEAYYLSLGAAF